VEGYERIDPNYYFILAAKDGVVDDLLTYIYEGTSQTDIRAFGALAVLLGGDNTLLPFNEVAKIVETIEAKDPIDFNRLRASYQIAALYNTDESLALLKKRMKPNFWQFRADGIPSYTTKMTDAPGHPPVTENAQVYSAIAVSMHPSPEAETFLRSILRDPRYADNELILDWARASLRERHNHLADHAKRQDAQRIKNEREGKVAEVVPSVASEVVENFEEATPPEAATEEPSVASTFEPSEEPIKQPFQWWLWLIGAFIVVVGLGLAIRRKS